jgi:hypothetical protein
VAAAARAQQSAEDAAAGAAACAACGAIGLVGIVVPLAILALNIWLLIWVARDAKSRGMDTPVLWMILVFFTSVIGLVIYLSVRPKGEPVACPHCGNKRLPALATCPTCGKP